VTKVKRDFYKLVIGLLVISMSIFKPLEVYADNPKQIDDADTVWIIGYDVNGFSCWSLSSSKRIPTLQVKISGRWVNKAKAKLSKNTSICGDKKYPWLAIYNWKVDEFGTTPNAGSSARDLMVRQYLPKFGSNKAFVGDVFTKQVYSSNSDRIKDAMKVLEEELGVGSGPTGSSSSSSSKLAGCRYKGKKLYGKIQIVDFLPDIKVQVVDFLPDLKVQVVDFLPTSCGKWEFVDFLPDLKVQFVDFLPDIKIQYVDFLPGLN
jgi:hypothetical protein